MAQAARRATAPAEATTETVAATEGGTWPHALSHDPALRVSDVLAAVQREFPTLTTSKLRFLDNEGLVSPPRTQSGYRLYSQADIERLRFVLRQQRDHYRPLTVIREQLEALDSGRLHEPVTLREVSDAPDDYLPASVIAERGGVTQETLAALEGAGLIAPTVPDGYEPGVVDVVVAASAYLEAGGDIRALRTLVMAAGREVDRAAAVAAPLRRRGAGEAEHAAGQFGEAAIAVFSAAVRRQVGG